jgi:hypothetical protein
MRACLVVAMTLACSHAQAGQAPSMESATASYWTELSKACAEVGSALDVRPGFVRELDLNGDGVPDAILSTEHGSCATAPSMFAGTAGEAARWLVSRPGGFETLDFMYQKVEIDEATKPPRVTMFLHGMACGKVGADRCRHVFRIEGAKVVTVSWPDGQASPAKSGKDETTQDADDPMPVVRAGHNGSTVELIGDRIVYLSPKAALRDVVKAGTVIFDGKWIGKGFVGTAYAFKKGCPPAPYPVKGAYAGRPGQLDIVLLGDGPIRQGCEVVGYSDRSPHSRLVFDRIMSN